MDSAEANTNTKIDPTSPLLRLYYNPRPDSTNKDDMDDKYERSYMLLQKTIKGLTETEKLDKLALCIKEDKSNEEMITIGMIIVILIDPQYAEKTYHDLKTLHRDGLHNVAQNINILIQERFPRLKDIPRSQVLWLVREMVRNMVPSVDNICWCLMRHAACGDTSAKNIALVESLLDLYQENRKWLEKFPWLVASVVYSFLRFIEDHSSNNVSKLRQREVTFAVTLLRERFSDCLVIGRDLIRVLQHIARIPEIEFLWKDMLYDPTCLAPNFTGITQLLQMRTSRRLLQSRLTPEVEKKLVYFTSSVRFENHKRYQEWFQKQSFFQYLATPDTQTLRSDLIRFIVNVIYPTNECISSDVIPRWAIIGWLITSCTNTFALAHAKLSLFYDWLFFDPEKENVMNLEPAVLLMTNSLKTNPSVTATLLDFLCRIIPNFYPPLRDKVKNGVNGSLRHILEKRVLSSLLPLFDNPRLDKDLKLMIRETFPEFCSPAQTEVIVKVEDKTENGNTKEGKNNNKEDDEDIEEKFSDDEEDEETDDEQLIMDTLKSERMYNNVLPDTVRSFLMRKKEMSGGTLQILPEYRSLRKEYKLPMLRLFVVSDRPRRFEAMEIIVDLLLLEVISDISSLDNVIVVLSFILHLDFDERIFPKNPNEQTLKATLGSPVFSLLRGYIQAGDNDTQKTVILRVLIDLQKRYSKVGYLLLYYLQVTRNNTQVSANTRRNSFRSHIYKDFCLNQEKKFENCLIYDLERCIEEEIEMFFWIIPTVYAEFSKFAVGNSKMMELVVSTVDCKQMQNLVCLILQGQLLMLQNDSLSTLVADSLEWETLQQYSFWQLVNAHNITIEKILTVLPKLDYSVHNEPITSILLRLRKERPTNDLLKPILCRELKPLSDLFVVTILQSWCKQHCNQLATVIADLLTSRCPAPSPSKRKRGQGQGLGSRTGVSPPSAERILGHLDRVRVTCKPLFKVDCIQSALTVAQTACTDTQRELYGSLFSLLDDKESSPPSSTKNDSNTNNTNNNGSGSSNNNSKSQSSTKRGRKITSSYLTLNSNNSNTTYLSKHRSTSSRASMKELSDSSEESEEEKITRRRPKKRKKREISDSE